MPGRILLFAIVACLFLSACASSGARVGGGSSVIGGSISGTVFKF